MTIQQQLLPMAVIMSIFYLIWIIKYPTELKEFMFFQTTDVHITVRVGIFIYTWISLIALPFSILTLTELLYEIN
jgi:hypothetical protein